MNIQLFATTHVGMVRDHNEDNFIVCENLNSKNWQFSPDAITEVSDQGVLLFVADGMGGTNAGEVASDIAQESIKTFFSERLEECKSIKEFMFQAISYAHDKIIQRQNEDDETTGMGTTAILGWIRDNELHLAWSGDSRAYVVRSGLRPYPVTDDHSIVWQMVMEGSLTPEEARIHPDSNLIMQSLGEPRNLPKPSYKRISLQKGDLVLLCSDGLNGMIPDEEIFLLGLSHQKVSDIVKELVNKANQEGGYDNITAIAAKIIEGPQSAREYVDSQKTIGNKSPKTKQSILIAVLIFLVALVLGLIFWNAKHNSLNENYFTDDNIKLDSIFQIIDSLESNQKIDQALEILSEVKLRFPDEKRVVERIESLEKYKTPTDNDNTFPPASDPIDKREFIDSLLSAAKFFSDMGKIKEAVAILREAQKRFPNENRFAKEIENLETEAYNASVQEKLPQPVLNKENEIIESEIDKIMAAVDSLEKAGELNQAILLIQSAQKSYPNEKRILEKLKALQLIQRQQEISNPKKIDSIKNKLQASLKRLCI
ncbi:MAG: protein phosphatase 2C domain-containing protein [Algoriphagus sp.]|uniref:PP2C family protein-serine/threonine phosphatase n=1 Tax=Algoriphagus sp. TaxID=1872435 RepID=UPI00262EBBA1|nr:protein phosphatase 2C domain-containing protein [Algoriphagus sp.]MDG1279301.1 protein phosphatase 2C domain-containing protein [Algoriphagus sp.]